MTPLDSVQALGSDPPSTKSPDVSVIIPVRNGGNDFEDCLRHLMASQDCRFEVIVVDDASTDDTAQSARSFGARVFRQTTQRGPAAARNLGATHARGEALVFIDADVLVTPTTLSHLFESVRGKDWVAAFGSYDQTPTAPNLTSQYKNLMHHHFHQQAASEAWTFWTGCGIIRRAIFEEVGGFSESFARPSVEDIELGMRLRQAGYRVRLVPEIQVTHTKRWTPWNLFRTDVFQRGVPWTRLMLRDGGIPNDLNVRFSQRMCVALAGLTLLLLAGLTVRQPSVLFFPVIVLATACGVDFWSGLRPLRRARRILAVLILSAIVIAFLCWMPAETAILLLPVILILVANRSTWRFLAQRRGRAFSILCVPLQLAYYFNCGVSFVLGSICHTLRIPLERPSAVSP